MVRVRIVGRQADAPTSTWPATSWPRTVGNGTLADHDPAGVPAPRRPQGRPRRRRSGAINESLLSTLAACGDVERNVLCCPAPIRDARPRRACRPTPTAGPSHCAPRSSSYWDIWLDGEKIENPLPPPPGRSRSRPPATTRSSRSTARRTSRASSRRPSPCPRTTAPTSTPTTWATWRSSRTASSSATTSWSAAAWARPRAPEDVPVPGRAALLRRPRRRPRDRRGGPQGLPRLRQPLRPQAGPAQVHHPRLGPARLPGQGRGVPRPSARRPEAGRRSPTSTTTSAGTSRATASSSWASRSRTAGSRTTGDFRLFSGLRAFFEKYRTPGRLTCQQSILLIDLEPAVAAGDRGAGWKSTGSPRSSRSRRSAAGRWPARRCRPAAWPSPRPSGPCRRSWTSSKPSSPGSGLEDERFTVRMTGCPNGCARPYNSDIGLVGRSADTQPRRHPGPGTYTIFLGGRTLGDRLNVEFKDYVPFDRVVAELRPRLRPVQGRAARRRDVRRLLRPGRRRGTGAGRASPRARPGRLSRRPSRTIPRGTRWRSPQSESIRSSLDAAATQAAARAYCPYSRFRVGAAVLTDDGRHLRGLQRRERLLRLDHLRRAERGLPGRGGPVPTARSVIRAVAGLHADSRRRPPPAAPAGRSSTSSGPTPRSVCVCDGPEAIHASARRASCRGVRAAQPGRYEQFASRVHRPLRASRGTERSYTSRRMVAGFVRVEDAPRTSRRDPVACFQGGNHDATDRGVESEGRGGQDDDDGEPRRRAGDRGAQDAGPRPRSPGPRHAPPGPPAGPVRAVALRGPDRRACRWRRSAARSRPTSRSAAATSTWPAPSSSCSAPSAARSSSATSSTPTPSRSTIVLMDCPPSLSVLTLNALCAATRGLHPAPGPLPGPARAVEAAGDDQPGLEAGQPRPEGRRASSSACTTPGRGTAAR